MTNYPVMFTFRDAVSGNGFLSGVTLGGRALIVHEPEDQAWRIYGVRPAPIAESGNTPLEAFANFRNAYKNVLFDFAERRPHLKHSSNARNDSMLNQTTTKRSAGTMLCKPFVPEARQLMLR